MSKTRKVEVQITENQSWNSCHRVGPDQEVVTFGAVRKLESIMHFDSTLYKATYFSHNMAPLRAVQMHTQHA